MRITLDARARRVLRWIGWPVLALMAFVISLQLTFPYDRVKDKLVEALSARYDVSIRDVERGWLPGKMILESVTLIPRTNKPGDKEGTMHFDRIAVDVDLLGSLLSWGLDADFDVDVGGGTLTGSVGASKDELSVSMRGRNVAAGAMPGLADTVGLPMTGKVDTDVDLDLPKNDWRQATGKLRLTCGNGCTVGDGLSKLKFKLRPGTRQSAFADEGVTIDKIFIDKLVGQVDIGKGRMTLSTLDIKSKDLEAMIELQVQLGKEMSASTVTTGCVRYKPLEELLHRGPRTHAALMSTGAPLGDDGYYHIKLSGKLTEMKRLPQICGGGAGGGEGDVAGRGGRPSLGGRALSEDIPASPTPPLPPAAVVPPSEMQMPEPGPPVDQMRPPGDAMGPGAGAGSAMPPNPNLINPDPGGPQDPRVMREMPTPPPGAMPEPMPAQPMPPPMPPPPNVEPPVPEPTPPPVQQGGSGSGEE